MLKVIQQSLENYDPEKSKGSRMFQTHHKSELKKKLKHQFEAIKKLVWLQSRPANGNVKTADSILQLVSSKNLPFIRYRVCALNLDHEAATKLRGDILDQLAVSDLDLVSDAYTAIAWWWEIFTHFGLPSPPHDLTVALFANLSTGNGNHICEALLTIKSILKNSKSKARLRIADRARKAIVRLQEEIQLPESLRRFENIWVPNITDRIKKVKKQTASQGE
jgi:hypothetical protein